MPARKLTPQAVVTTALALADRHGLEALTMRAGSPGLGVEAMSLYHHFASRDALLDAMVDRVYAAILLPEASGQWRASCAVDRSRSDRSSTPTSGRFR